MEINNRQETRPNVALKRLSSALTARLVLTVLIIASISVFSLVGTVTAQQNNTSTTATTTATPPPSVDIQESQSPATVPTPVEPTGTPTPLRDIQEYQPTLPATETLTSQFPETETETETPTPTPTPTATATPTPTVTPTDSPGFGIFPRL